MPTDVIDLTNTPAQPPLTYASVDSNVPQRTWDFLIIATCVAMGMMMLGLAMFSMRSAMPKIRVVIPQNSQQPTPASATPAPAQAQQ